MLITRFLKLASAAVLLSAVGTAKATSISLTPQVSNVAVGDIVALEIIADFSDVTTIGGNFAVSFDPDALGLVSWTSSYPGDPAFWRDPDIFDGELEGFSFGDFAGLSGIWTLGVLEFEVLAAGTTEMAPRHSGFVNSGFVDANTFQPIPIDFGPATINAVVPVPAAAWLMVGGLGALFGFARQRA